MLKKIDKQIFFTFAAVLSGILIFWITAELFNKSIDDESYLNKLQFSNVIFSDTAFLTSGKLIELKEDDYSPINYLRTYRKKKIYVSYETKKKISATVSKYAAAYKLSPELLLAVINIESGFNPYAVSPKGACGLMQIMPALAFDLGVNRNLLFNIENNIEAGARYLKRLLNKYNNNLNLSLAAYNAGPNAVDLYRNIPPYTETMIYVRKVINQYYDYLLYGNEYF